MVYFDVRPSQRFETLEVRVADVCLTVDDAVLLGGLARALVRTAAEAAQEERPFPRWRPELVRGAHWRAARWGLTAELVSPLTGRPAPAAEVVDALVEHVRPALEAAGDLDEVTALLEQVRGAGHRGRPPAGRLRPPLVVRRRADDGRGGDAAVPPTVLWRSTDRCGRPSTKERAGLRAVELQEALAHGVVALEGLEVALDGVEDHAGAGAPAAGDGVGRLVGEEGGRLRGGARGPPAPRRRARPPGGRTGGPPRPATWRPGRRRRPPAAARRRCRRRPARARRAGSRRRPRRPTAAAAPDVVSSVSPVIVPIAPGEVGGALALEEGHDHHGAAVVGRRLPVEAHPAGHPVDGDGGVEGARQREEEPGGVGEAGHDAAGVGGRVEGGRVHGARRAEARGPPRPGARPRPRAAPMLSPVPGPTRAPAGRP